MTATTFLGKVAIIPKGIWDASTAYSKLNAVTIGGSSYIAVQDVPAGTSVSNTTYWQVLAEKGTSGGVGQLADEFSTSNAYEVGDYCSYNQDVYRFTTAHQGAWDVADVVLVSIANELKQKMTDSEVQALIEESTSAEAEKLETARTIEVNLASGTSASFDGSQNISTGVTGVLPVARGGTGNANGTASALTTARTMKTNLASTSSASFDGSQNVTLGVTGVLPVDNGGTGNSDGTVAKLTTARTIRTNLASTSTASFDGSANVTPGVTGVLPVANGGTGNNAGTAAKLTTARSLYVNLGSNYNSSSPVTFDGSANKALPVNGTLSIAHGGTGATERTGMDGAVAKLFSSNLGASSEYVMTITGGFESAGYAGLPLSKANGGTGGTDSGWKSLTNSSAFDGTIRYRAIGDWIFVLLYSIKPKTAVTGLSGSPLTLGTLPEGYRPAYNLQIPLSGSSDGVAGGRLAISTAGVMSLYRSPNGTSIGTSDNVQATVMFYK